MSFNCRLLVSIAFAGCGALLLVAVSARADEDSNADNKTHQSFSSWVSGLFSAAGYDSGNSSTQTRELAPFRAISIKGSTDVEVQIGTPQQVSVAGDEKLLDTIDLRVDDNRLIVTAHGASYSHRMPKVKVQVPAMDAIDIEGSGDVSLHGLDGGKLQLLIAGSGDIRSDGKVDELSLHIAGSGDASLQALTVKKAAVQIDGSGDASITATESLDAVSNGSGDIRYGGDPKQVNLRSHGSGDIHKSL